MCKDASAMLCLGFFVAVQVAVAQAAKGICYDFRGESGLEYSPVNLNISDSVHYSLEFRTSEAEGIIMYSEGRHDYEALFVSDGKLVYLLANPSPSGVEGTSGGLYITNNPVNTGQWYKVDMWRNWEVSRGRLRRPELRTGITIYDAVTSTEIETHTDDIYHRGVVLSPRIYVGGVRSGLINIQESSVPKFRGDIRDVTEDRNLIDFRSYNLNFGKKVNTCS